VDVTLSATDPAETGTGGGTPATVVFNAEPGQWDRTTATAKVGDTTRWNFPAIPGQTPHDLWVVKPGEDVSGGGTLLVTGDLPIVLPGGPSINYTVSQAGKYTFLCKVHPQMIATVDVTEGGGSTVPGSGVDYTEYRVNGGAWTKNTNTGTASPFVTTFKAEADGDYAIDYRSADKAGNVEATKSVSFKIQKPTGPVDSVTEEVDVTASVPRVLGISLAGPVTFGAITPGVAKDYDAGATVQATSSLAASKLTIHDNSSVATGHLVNGTLPMPQALKVGAGTGAFGALGGAAAPTVLATWAHPLANEAVELKFRQSVAATDRLLVGNYSKRVTLTLSATTP
jgi:plastocyanin